MMRYLALAVLLLAACSQPAPQPSPAATAEAPPTAAAKSLAGKWVGVEGLYLVVTPETDGRFTLEMQYGTDASDKQVTVGRASGSGIAFERDGRAMMLTPGNGAATGLKYLAGKKDCLAVQSGEGYCRD